MWPLLKQHDNLTITSGSCSSDASLLNRDLTIVGKRITYLCPCCCLWHLTLHWKRTPTTPSCLIPPRPIPWTISCRRRRRHWWSLHDALHHRHRQRCRRRRPQNRVDSTWKKRASGGRCGMSSAAISITLTEWLKWFWERWGRYRRYSAGCRFQRHVLFSQFYTTDGFLLFYSFGNRLIFPPCPLPGTWCPDLTAEQMRCLWGGSSGHVSSESLHSPTVTSVNHGNSLNSLTVDFSLWLPKNTMLTGPNHSFVVSNKSITYHLKYIYFNTWIPIKYLQKSKFGLCYQIKIPNE